MVDDGELRTLLDERPDLEPALRAVLEPSEPWSFDDVDVDSGAFGELVSRGVVEEGESGYRVADRAAVESVLSGGERPSGDDNSVDLSLDRSSVRMAGFVTVSLLVVAVSRLLSAPAVFRGDDVVLSGNDPYYYTYWIERLVVVPEFPISPLPSPLTQGEPLFVTTLASAATVLGGTRGTVVSLLAVYPVATAVVSGLLVYVVAVRTTDDVRVGLAAVALFGIVPGHAFRTSLGFGDHHAFDYLWLVVTLTALTVLVDEITDRRTPRLARVTVAVAAIGVGVGAQVLSWTGGALMLGALAVYLLVDPVLAVRHDRHPVATTGPVLVGVALGTAAVWFGYSSLGWQTPLAVVAPLLVLGGGVSITVVAESVVRSRLPPMVVPASVVLGAVAGSVGVATIAPGLWDRATSTVSTRLLGTTGVAESAGLFGPSLGWLLLFGFVFVLAVPYLLYGTRRALDHATWAPLVVYAWYFLVLAGVQVRFVGQLAPVIAVFAGLGFTHLAERIDVVSTRPASLSRTDAVPTIERPSWSTVRAVVVLFLLVGSLSFVQIPIKTNQVTHSSGAYGAASWMERDSRQRGLDDPQNYVFSQWGDNRFYNYHVNGESRSYGYARQRFATVVTATDPSRWYTRLYDRAGFIVVTSDAVTGPDAIGTLLYRHDGNPDRSVAGINHYQLGYVSADERVKVFALVSGATIRGQAQPNETLDVEQTVSVGGYTLEYEREVTANATGGYSVRVPYPGNYSVDGRRVSVPRRAVYNGTTVPVDGGRRR